MYSVLHSFNVPALALLGGEPFPSLHPSRLEGVLQLQSTGDGCIPAVPLLRGAPLRHIHRRDARHPGPGDLERRDGHRTAEEGGGAMGEKIALEKYTVGVRPFLGGLVLAVRPAHAQIEIRELFIFGVIGLNINVAKIQS